MPADCIASYSCNQRLIKLQCEISEREQAHQINISQFIILTRIEVLHNKVTYKGVFINLKLGAAINVHPICIGSPIYYYIAPTRYIITGIWPDRRRGGRAFYSLVYYEYTAGCRRRQMSGGPLVRLDIYGTFPYLNRTRQVFVF